MKKIAVILICAWLAAGTFALIAPHEWLKLRAEAGDQQATRLLIAETVAEKNLDSFFKWKGFLNADPLNYPYMSPADRDVLIKLKEAIDITSSAQ